MRIQIRQATVRDVSAIAEVHVRSWQEAYKGLVPQDFLDAMDPAQRAAGWEQSVRSLPRSGRGVLVAESPDGVVGFSSFCPAQDADCDPERVGLILTIYLLPSALGKGIGRGLMGAVTSALTDAGYAEAVLWVLDTNARARSFYSKAGWSPDGSTRLDSSLGVPLNEVRYRRRLP
jgi:GNAT superfamily N-acetyltransferase